MWREELLRLESGLDHPAWGAAHSRRVRRVAMLLAERQGYTVDGELLLAAGCLHDLGAFPQYRRPGVDHADRSAEVAGELLPRIGFPAEKVKPVQEIIAGHMFDREPAAGAEARVFHDADALDFLGAIGITRLLSIAGRDDWTPDLRAAVTLARRFRRELPGRLHTPLAKRMGADRREQMSAFLDALEEQTEGLREL